MFGRAPLGYPPLGVNYRQGGVVHDAALTLSTVAAATSGPQVAIDAALVLSVAPAIAQAAGLSFDAALPLAIAASLADSVVREIDAAVPLGVVADTLSGTLAALNTDVGFALRAGQSQSGGLNVSAAVTLEWRLGVTENGTDFELIIAPKGRVVVISATERVVTVSASERVVTVH